MTREDLNYYRPILAKILGIPESKIWSKIPRLGRKEAIDLSGYTPTQLIDTKRAMLGYKVVGFCAEVGISPSHYYAMISGDIGTSESVLGRIEKILEIEIDREKLKVNQKGGYMLK